jgi:hypothetical protein
VRRVLLYGFLLGALGVFVFHQGVIFLLFHYGNHVPFLVSALGRVSGPGWNLHQMMPNPPLRGLAIPLLLNQMFWGGLWGIAIAAMLRFTRFPSLLGGLLIGVLGCVGVAMTLVVSLKGQPLFAGGNGQTLLRAALINGAFGWGTALLLRPFGLRKVEVRGYT